jgi:hypothetical protein
LIVSEKDYPGQEHDYTQADEYSAHQFMMEQVTARVSNATLVQVKKVTTNGQVAPVGFVDVLPLVKMQDSTGTVRSHGVVHSLPYFRLQGGSGKAVIMDPKVGDIGIAIFADRDISTVKKTKKESAPGSFRKSSMADGMFLGCFLGEKPTCYVQFTDDNKIILSPDDGTSIATFEAGRTTIKAVDIILDGTVRLGGPGASRQVSAIGTQTSDGAIDSGNFLTKVYGL